MKKDVELVSSDRRNWLKNHTLTEEQKAKLIERKINLINQYLASAKSKAKK